MNHRLDKTYRKRRTVIVSIAAFALFFLALQKGFLGGAGSFLSRLVTPLWQAQNFTSDYLAVAVSSKKELWKQNELLRAEVERLTLRASVEGNVRDENEKLKDMLGRKPVEAKFVLAAILAKPNVTPYDTLIIDRGSADGIALDMRVFVGGDVLVGEVESVEEHTARVILYSAPGIISQVVYGNTGRFFNARGQGNGTFEVDVARDIEVAEGDMFFYPGYDNTPLGVAKKVDFDARDSFKQVLMKSPVNIQEERWVEVRI